MAISPSPRAGAPRGLPVANFDGTAGSSNFNGSSGTCTANVQRLQMISVGFWQDFYKGDLGRMRYGVNYEWIQQDLFNGLPGSVAGGLHPNNNIVFFSLRYYPFN